MSTTRRSALDNIVGIDATRHREFKRALDPHKCFIQAVELASNKYSYWLVRPHKNSYNPRTLGFDCDVETLIAQLDAGVAWEDISLIPNIARAAKTTTTGADKVCVMCAEPGGLPCPKMVAEAGKLGVRLHAGGVSLHPGRCRARLRACLLVATQNSKS